MTNQAHVYHFREVAKMVFMVLVVLLLSSCGVCRHTPTLVQKDSTRVEVREVTTYVHDTIEVQLPSVVERVVVRDSSFLSNDVAESRASIDEEGFLHHSLETKKTAIPVPVSVPTHRRDSIVYVDRVKEVRVPVVTEKPLSWWQQTQLRGFWALLLVVLGYAAIKLAPIAIRIIRIVKKI